MTLGYMGRPDWRDMSDYLVHFTDSRSNLDKILAIGEIEARNAYGAVRKAPSYLPSQKSISLSEIPLDRLDRLIDRHGPYGIGFRKDWAIERNATRVWYLDQGSAISDFLFEWAQFGRTAQADPWQDDNVYRITPFIDYGGTFGGTDHRFEWEREWRILDGLVFDPSSDPAFIFVPHGESTSVNVSHVDPTQATTSMADFQTSIAAIESAWGDAS